MKTLYQLAENENIEVYEDHLPGDLKGFFYRNNKKNIICLEKRLNNTNKRIVFAEELGHYFCSYNNGVYFSKSTCRTFTKNEYVARKWASEFLIPDKVFKRSVINNVSDLSTFEIVEDLGVTVDFLRFRFGVWKRNIGKK